ncbi:MAG: hypothetical protein RIQ48_630 [Pseudomonadota bacterium]|jgi:hypothetical protein
MKSKLQIIKNIILLLIVSINNIYSQENKPFAFISSVGTSVRQSELQAFNVAYMNNLRVVSVSNSKQGNIWTSIVKVVSK